MHECGCFRIPGHVPCNIRTHAMSRLAGAGLAEGSISPNRGPNYKLGLAAWGGVRRGLPDLDDRLTPAGRQTACTPLATSHMCVPHTYHTCPIGAVRGV